MGGRAPSAGHRVVGQLIGNNSMISANRHRTKWQQRLLDKMLAAGLSRYDADPMAALRRSGGHGGFAKI